MITYTPDGLTITIKTPSPEAEHENLMRAVTAGLYWSGEAELRKVDHANVSYLAMFLEELIPDEKQLSCT